MKILALADFHNNKGILEKVKPMGFDLVIIAGDISNNGPLEFVDEVIEDISSSTKVFAVPGNMDIPETKELLIRRGVSLEGSVEYGGFRFVGMGGANKAPFDSPLDYTEEEIYEFLKDKVDENTILVTHAPPYDTKADMIPNGMHVGSKSIKKIIEEKQPVLNICAHIHESQAVDAVGRTRIVNVGPSSEGHYAVIDTDTLEIKLV